MFSYHNLKKQGNNKKNETQIKKIYIFTVYLEPGYNPVFYLR